MIGSATLPYPVFIVSAEGGGIRAAFWTAGLLCAIQDEEPGFADHVLGISGVSGGSLGAATFAALVAETRRTGLDGPRNADGMGPLQHLAGEVLGRDFLSPVLATMLIPDVAACLLHGEWAEDFLGGQLDSSSWHASDPPAYAGGLYESATAITTPHTSPGRQRLCRNNVWRNPTRGFRSPRPIQARSVSDGIGTTCGGATPVASDPPAHAGGLYGSMSDCVGATIDVPPCVASDPHAPYKPGA